MFSKIFLGMEDFEILFKNEGLIIEIDFIVNFENNTATIKLIVLLY